MLVQKEKMIKTKYDIALIYSLSLTYSQQELHQSRSFQIERLEIGMFQSRSEQLQWQELGARVPSAQG